MCGNETITSMCYFCEVPNVTSKYIGVSWNRNRKKWKAQLTHNKKLYFGGLFDNEEHAAMKVNSLCGMCELEYKNSIISQEPNGIQQVIHQKTFKNKTKH
jgi:hypothetical protein